MRLIKLLVTIAVIGGIAALFTKPDAADFDAFLTKAVQQRAAAAQVGNTEDSALKTAALVGCKLRPGDCAALVREAVDVTVDEQLLWTQFSVRGLGRETECTGAFTRIWCADPLI